MRLRVAILIIFAAALSAQNVQPILSGSGKILFPETAAPNSAYIKAASGALNFYAGGTNQGLIFRPTGIVTVGVGSSLANATFYVGTQAFTGTNAWGLQVLAPSGATNNYAAAFTGGNVGIGTTSPAAALDIAAPGGNALIVRGNAPTNSWGALFVSQTNGGFGVYDSAAKSYFAGNVGIGLTGPNYALDVTGDTNTSGVFRKGGTAGLSTSPTTSAGAQQTFSGGILTTSSTGAPTWTYGAGVPAAGACTIVGSLYSNTSGGALTTLYVCTAVNTWTAK